MQQHSMDPRYFQVLFQVLFLGYGILYLHWDTDLPYYVVILACCTAFNYLAECLRNRRWLSLRGSSGWRVWGLSATISAMGLCLLLKSNHWWIGMIAAALTVGSKYLFRFSGKHLFNPSAFGIVATIWLTGDAWLSAGQWGNGIVLIFFVLTFGTVVVTSVQKLDVSLAFLLTYGGLLLWRQVWVLGWPADHFIHSITTGGLLLFTFFMISDPRTSPNHPVARIIWAMAIALVSFWLAAFRFEYNTPVWVLVAAAPLVPLLDRLFRARGFRWAPVGLRIPYFSKPK